MIRTASAFLACAEVLWVVHVEPACPWQARRAVRCRGVAAIGSAPTRKGCSYPSSPSSQPGEVALDELGYEHGRPPGDRVPWSPATRHICDGRVARTTC